MKIYTVQKAFVAVCVLAFGMSVQAQKYTADYRVIPLPESVSTTPGIEAFPLTDRTTVVCKTSNKKMRLNAQFLSEYVEQLCGIRMPIANKAPKSGTQIVLALNSKESSPTTSESYSITVSPQQVVIEASTEAGIFYGIQTLRKSMPTIPAAEVLLPAATITDTPRFSYRGMHLDVCRHYFPVSFIKKYIDILALHHVNRFHWHITEDQGWRIEIKKYPRLTQIGASREETVIGHNSGRYDGIPYGPYFYTQDECREIVRYAAERYIEVIPEIDMPGHMQGALAAYPELGCTGGPYKVWTMWGVSDDVLCAGNPEVVTFLQDVLLEVMDVFPSKYIHVGGDECPKTRWKQCLKCQAKAAELGYKPGKYSVEEQLQSYLIHKAEEYLNAHGRDMIGWDETLEGGLAPNATIMSWRGVKGGIEAAKQHHNVIMTPNTYCYFDYYQTKDHAHEPDCIGGHLPVEQVFSCEPTDGLNDEQSKYIIGVQANIWTEYIPDGNRVEYMALPRMAALAEVQWLQKGTRCYEDFLKRLPHMADIYQKLGYNYARHLDVLKKDF